MRLLCLIALLFTGCLGPRGSIKSAIATVVGVKDAGKPAVLASNETRSALAIPQGSKMTVIRTEPLLATQTAAAVPASEVTTFDFSKPTQFETSSVAISADTGTVDQSVALRKIDVAERRWLLWVAIAAGVGGIVLKSVLPQWPSLSNGLLLASGLAFASWKLADIPSWIWLLGGIGALLALGYKRAEWDKDGDGTPDIIQKKTVTTSTVTTTPVPPAQV